MNLDKEKVRRLLDEVVNTSGYASAQKADELLRYVRQNVSADTSGTDADQAPMREMAEAVSAVSSVTH